MKREIGQLRRDGNKRRRMENTGEKRKIGVSERKKNAGMPNGRNAHACI